MILNSPVATVLTACGIETTKTMHNNVCNVVIVATVLTACGIETVKYTVFFIIFYFSCNSAYRLRY